jgi:peptidoglycan/LPS O-acetylase OafA/YrhL
VIPPETDGAGDATAAAVGGGHEPDPGKAGAGERKNFGLDLLRATAILTVVAGHGYQALFFLTGLLPSLPQLYGLVSITFLGVEWFFVLSGFLIGSILIRTFERPGPLAPKLRQFWVRRWFRTLPNYYLFLMVNVLLVALHLAGGRFSLPYATFTQNLAWPDHDFFLEAWSLSIEEWFYVVFPLLLAFFILAVGRRQKRYFFLAAATLVLYPLIVRALMPPPLTGDAFDFGFRRIVVLRLDAAGWGVLAAGVAHWFPRSFRAAPRWKLIAGATMLFASVVLYLALILGSPIYLAAPRLCNTLVFPLTSAGTAFCLPWLVAMRRPARGVQAIVSRISVYSYSLYLCHMPVLALLMHAAGPETFSDLGSAAGFMAFWVAASFAVAALTYHKFERPLTDLRERFSSHVRAQPFGSPAGRPP